MLYVVLGFLLLTSIAFGIPFAMGGLTRAQAASRGLVSASVVAVLYVVGYVIARSV